MNATGGGQGGGIGSGQYGTCGNITISGGTVVAKGDGDGSGIGCGGGSEEAPSVCGDIMIRPGGGFVSVTAIRGGYALSPIGPSSNDNGCFCGNITFDDYSIYSYGFYYVPGEGNYSRLIFTISSSDPDDIFKKGDTWTLTPAE